MYDHNDYVMAVKQYLIRYREFTTYIENVKADIADYKAKLQLNAAPKVPSLSPAPSGGGGENTSQQERDYFSKEAIPNKIAQLQRDIARIEPMINRLNRSLEALPPTDRGIITRRLIDNESWMIITSDLHVTEGYCHRRISKIIKQLAGMMFGPKAIPLQTHFVFFEEDKENENGIF
ncbi:hypothetical protein AB840_12120 [Megasphaera cerevisiae DSM 20462]|uniref:Uncharacterized protein n=1 Tax=Megasphaera cerevisiae DSM 20462 TaxID=1122219 RepID=A0A0J6WV55_9FIRM|nr:hypothetical protein [Megasphaera cerevisiae]KMO85677.1 hypothetical protein AB840_12120 [Megasphaera cerevisiae DSM 20462]SKA11567.1 hypothetical protein SAMN05660900_02471 [Megasphaera cerevisiae DSM 20462]